MPESIPAAYMEIALLGQRLGVQSIKDLPGCWEHQVDEHWWIAVNGHSDKITCSSGVEVSPLHAYIEFNGFPAGVVSPWDGTIAAGEAANEDAFIHALQAAGRSA